LSIGLGALINAGLLLGGLLRRGTYRPSPGWMLFGLQVFAATALLTVLLMWASSNLPWVAWRAEPLVRAGAMALLLAGSGVLYFGALLLAGVKLKQFITR